MSFIGDLFGGADSLLAGTAGPFGAGDSGKAGDKVGAADKPIEIDNPPQKPAKPPVDQKGGGTGDGFGAVVTGGGNSLLGGGTSTPYG